jgi:hypothetical protein
VCHPKILSKKWESPGVEVAQIATCSVRQGCQEISGDVGDLTNDTLSNFLSARTPAFPLVCLISPLERKAVFNPTVKLCAVRQSGCEPSEPNHEGNGGRVATHYGSVSVSVSFPIAGRSCHCQQSAIRATTLLHI